MTNQQAIHDAEFMQARGSMYSFLAEIYNKEIDADELSRLQKLPADNDVETSPFSVAMHAMQGYVSSGARDDEMVNALSVDFANIFLGANKSTNGAYPYESVYTSPEGLLRQDSTDEVFRTYLEDGLAQGMHYNVPEDHISLEFSYMAQLIERSLAAIHDGDEDQAALYEAKQQEFFIAHLQPWVCLFTAKGQSFAKTSFYVGVLNLTEAFMRDEAELLN